MSIAAKYRLVSEAESEDLNQNPDCLIQLLFPEKCDASDVRSYDIDKSWQVLHFVLTGTVDANKSLLGQAIFGGEAIGDELDYGPVRFLSACKVREVFVELESVDFNRKFNQIEISNSVVDDVYLGREFLEEGVESLAPHFSELKNIYQIAVDSESGLLIYLT